MPVIICKHPLMMRIAEISFTMDDLRLYLDTHPNCKEALVYFVFSVRQMCVSVFGPAPYCFVCCSFVVQFETKGYVTSSFLLLSQDCFGYLWYFVFPYKFKNCICPSSVKNAIGILIEPTRNLQIALSNIVILIILILLIHEHSYLPICLCCLQFLSSVSYSFLV